MTKSMQSLSNKKWQIKTPFSSLPLLERICRNRKLDPNNELSELHSPWLLKDMEKAVEKLQTAIQQEERIMVFGDYDVDGVSGASTLYLGLQQLGAKVSVRLPHREKDGYGLNTKVLDECRKLDVKLVITVDCGISNVAEVKYGKELGLDIIITDHHSIPPQLPQAYAILNPKQQDCNYPDENICGTVVAYKLLLALNEKHYANKIAAQEFIDLAALATVADCMPLQGENRLIVKRGLQQMRQSKHRGLRTLINSYDLNDKPLSSYHLGYNIAPCINAAGRLEDPLIAFKMMMGDVERALELRRINEERQDIVRNALEGAIAQVEAEHKDDAIIILWNETWQAGIIGLLAGKLCEKYHKPVICLTKSEEKFVGSCRSIPQINIVEQLQQIDDLFLNYGGHAQAAGLSIAPEKLDTLRSSMIKAISDYCLKHPIEAILHLDTEIKTEEINLESIHALEQLEPFGMGNPKPKMLMKNMLIESTRIVGKDHSHLQLQLRSKDGQSFKTIAFNMAEHQSQLLNWQEIDIACQLNKNEFRGNTSVDLILIDAQQAHL